MKKKEYRVKIPNSIRDNPDIGAVVAKLNSDKKPGDKTANIFAANLPAITTSVQDKIKNNESIVKLFSDIELSIQISTSSIISPNDMLTTNLLYKTPELPLPASVLSMILDTSKNYIEAEYAIEKKLPTIIREALYTKGSYIEAIIPEAAVDEMINTDVYAGAASMEDIGIKISEKEGLGILASDDSEATISVEDICGLNDVDYSSIKDSDNIVKELEFSMEDLGVEISDNPQVLAIRYVAEEKIGSVVAAKLRGDDVQTVSVEENSELETLFRPTPVSEDSDVITVKAFNETIRSSIGKPLVLKIPPEATIPVHASGDTSKHLGYFILLDGNGVPVTESADWVKTTEDINVMFGGTGGDEHSIVSKAKKALTGITVKDPKIQNIEEVYSHIIDKRVKDKLHKGVFGKLVDIGDASEIYRVMLNRVLKKQKTKLLFLPSELVSFYAFKYRDNGTGESLLETVSVIASIRAILLFSRIMASIKNSVSTTEVKATLDEDDADPVGTMEKIISMAMKTRQTELPIGVTKLDDLVDWSHKVGMAFNIKHPGLPDMEIDRTEVSTSKNEPDSDLDEQLQRHMIMGFGLNPEIVNKGFEADFATTVVANSVLMAKRVSMQQDTINPQITSHVRKLLLNDANIRTRIGTILKNELPAIRKSVNAELSESLKIIMKDDDKIVEWLTEYIIKNINVTLPRPEMFKDDNMKEAFDGYKSSVEEYIGIMISDEALPEELVGAIGDNVEVLKNALSNTLLRKWMSENNYLPTLQKMISTDKDGKPIFDVLSEYEGYSKSVTEALLPFLKSNARFKNKTDKKVDKIENSAGEEETPPTEEPVKEQTEDDAVDVPVEDTVGGKGGDGNAPPKEEDLFGEEK